MQATGHSLSTVVIAVQACTECIFWLHLQYPNNHLKGNKKGINSKKNETIKQKKIR